MTEQEAIKKLKILSAEKSPEDWDPEKHHMDADKVLCELLSSLGYSEVVEEYTKVEKWYA